MKVERFSAPKSSFLSMEKDLSIIADRFLNCDRLKRLLYYTTEDALDKPNLTIEQSNSLFGRNIKTIPKLTVDGSVLNYIIINFDQFARTPSNPEFRSNVIEIDVVCHFDQWKLKDFQLRPYRIAAEIDSMLDKKHLTGIGDLEFLGANQFILTDEFAGLCLIYSAVHGEEDKKGMPNPQEEENFIEDFKKQYNIKE